MRKSFSLVIAAVSWIVTLGLTFAFAQEEQSDVYSYSIPGMQVYPECVAVNPDGTAFFTASSTDGTVYRGDLGSRAARVLVPASQAAIGQGLGVDVDDQGRLWVVGGPTGSIAVYDTESGEVVAQLDTPPAERTFLNDVVVAPNGSAYITDSMRPVIFRVTSSDGDIGEIEPWLELEGSPIEYTTGESLTESINLNGIAVTPDGSHLITVQMNTGQLFIISLEDGSIIEVDLGGETLTNGDGLVFDDGTLYVVRQADNEIVTVDLAEDLTSGQIVNRFSHEQLAFPACAALAGDELLVVNTQFNRQEAGNPLIPFQVLSFPVQMVRTQSGGQQAQAPAEKGAQAEQQDDAQAQGDAAGENEVAGGGQSRQAEGDDTEKTEPTEAQQDEADEGEQQDEALPRAEDSEKTEPVEGEQEESAESEQQAEEDQNEVAGGQQGQEADDEQLMQVGQEVYSQNCARCHGAQGEGDVGPFLAGNESLQDASFVIRQIAHGSDAMPAFGGVLTDEQLAGVSTYARNAWENDFGTITVAQVQQVLGQAEEGAEGQAQDQPGEQPQASNDVRPGTASIEGYSAVTAERLVNPEPENWLNFRRTYNGWGYSPLEQITSENVADLELAWSFSTGVTEGHESPAMVNNGVMYITTPDAKVIALDAATGEQFWEFQRDLADDLLQLHPTNRGIGFWQDKVYVATTDTHLIALDAGTGEVVWDATVEDSSRGYYMTLAPLIVNGKVMVGVSGGELGIRGFIEAFDAETGDSVWKTFTVPGEGEPGNETWPADTWTHGGGSVWMTGTYDPETNLTYWGVGNAAPWMGDARPGDNLWTASTIALDADTGELVHGFQFHHNDSWDWDEVVAPLLIDFERDGETVQGLVKVARNGYLWWLERSRDGIEFVDAKPYVFQNVFESLDPETGRPTYNEEAKPAVGKTAEFCPSLWGGRDWPPEAYNPDTGLLYVGANENLCHRMIGQQVSYIPGQAFTGASSQMFLREGWDHIGEVQAWNVNTGEIAWRHTFPESHIWAQMLTTAGDLVFAGGTIDRKFRAFDAQDGEVLWEVTTNSGVYGMPTTFAVDGVQYVAVQSGWGVDGTRMQNALRNAVGAPFDVEVPKGGVLWVFRLAGE
ncbi:MAG: PQQ-dependent dehydrogenase, methanol/ethanol family [Trueperaceae bacterium]